MFEFNSNRCLVRETIVIIDFQGHPIRFDQLGVYDEVIAQERCMRLDLQVQTQDSRGAWRHVASTELGEESLHWRSGLKAGAKQLQDLQVKASDPHYFKGSNKRRWLYGIICLTNTASIVGALRHVLPPFEYDAKLFVCAHPYGTGSLHSEFGRAEAICRSANLETYWLFWRCGKNVCVLARN